MTDSSYTLPGGEEPTMTSSGMRPIHELELAISGVVIVGLFQVPDLLDELLLELPQQASADAAPGLVTYLDLSGLDAGRQLIEVRRLAEPIDPDEGEQDRHSRSHIPFWYAPESSSG